MLALLGSFQVVSKPSTMSIPFDNLTAILARKTVVIADFSCMTTHNCRDYIKLLRERIGNCLDYDAGKEAIR